MSLLKTGRRSNEQRPHLNHATQTLSFMRSTHAHGYVQKLQKKDVYARGHTDICGRDQRHTGLHLKHVLEKSLELSMYFAQPRRQL